MRRSFLVISMLALHASVSARELVHPFPPGGPVEVIGASRANRALRAMQRYAAPAFTDTLATHVAQTLRGAGDEPVEVVRRHRRGGSEASAIVSAALPDGRTLLLASVPITPVRPQAGAATRLAKVAMVARMPYAWVLPADSFASSLGELLRGGTTRLLTAHPGERTVAYAPLERLRAIPASGVEPIAYNGGVAALNAVASAHAAAALVPLAAVLPYLGAGRIRVLAVADTARHESLPRVPTTAEAGLANAEAVVGFAVFAPADIPPSSRRPIAAALSSVADGDEARALFLGMGVRLEYRAGP
jgi:tripartite-type tricarboxylate transporter receptor subunit TctC